MRYRCVVVEKPSWKRRPIRDESTQEGALPRVDKPPDG
jgi:hypothetical protein